MTPYVRLLQDNRYIWLLEDERLSRRTMAEAILVLREFAGFKESSCAEVHVGLLTLFSGKVVGLINIQFESPCGETIYRVSLPTSCGFWAVREGSSQRECFEISRLDGAVVDSTGNVTLDDGTAIRMVKVIPTHLPYEPSDLDWQIVHEVVAILGAEEQCYRLWPDGLPFRRADNLSNKMKARLDCNALRRLNPPPLKVLKSAIADRQPSLKKLSLQKLSDTLAMFGIRQIKARPRLG
jgi:hypothetical protein